jgi:5'-3' exoribonuclease 2
MAGYTTHKQGVPALFRWLSKKYPKIVNKVVEETPTKVRNQDGEIVEVPVRYESKNPNGFEVDNLYCTCLRRVASID